MADITLQLNSPQGARSVPFEGDSLTVGREPGGALAVAGEAELMRRLATFCRSGERAWVVACSASDPAYVNNWPVPPEGRVLAHGDEVRIGNNGETVRVSFARATPPPPDTPQTAAAPTEQPRSSKTSPLVFLLPLLALVLVLLVGLGLYMLSSSTSDDTAAASDTSDNSSSSSSDETGEETAGLSDEDEATSPSLSSDDASSSSSSSSSAPPAAVAPSGEAAVLSLNNALTPPDPLPAPPPGSVKLYQQMSDDERREFIKRRAQRVSVMMGRRPYAIPDDAITEIKRWLDAFAKRIGNGGTKMWSGDTRAILERARLYSPTIIRVFKEHNVPVVIGLYIPFIETEYTNIRSENAAGAAGLFQFIPATARGYGVAPEERTNVDKMAPAAAKYFRDTIIQFGGDPMSVALAIAGYNRNPESVARDMREVLNEKDNTARERTFWTLIANKSKLDEKFQSENKEYVPRFFAAAILGETPWAFGLDLQPLSTYTQPQPGATLPPEAP